MSTDDTASNNSGGMSGRDSAQTDAERRAQWEAFEFDVPVAGRVRVENKSYGDESDEHEYVVAVEDESTVWCTCPADEYQIGPCKHRRAVEDTTPVMRAAIATEDEIEQARESDEPEIGDTRVRDGVPEVWVGEPDCPSAAMAGWVIDPDRAEPVDQSEQRERSYDLGVEDAAFGGAGGQA